MNIKKNLDIIVYEKIKEGFLKGEYKLGQKVDINEVAEKYEVSRTPVIQAMKRLENEWVFETIRGGKVTIPQYTPEKIKEIYDVRYLLEKYALECSIENDCARINFDLLEKYAEGCKIGYEENNRVNASKADLAFHSEIVKGANNEFLSKIYSKLQSQCMVVNYLISYSNEYHQNCCCKEHIGIIEGLRERDIVKCSMVLKQHLDRNVKRLLLALSKES